MSRRGGWACAVAGSALVLAAAGPVLPPLFEFLVRALRGEGPALVGSPVLWMRSLSLALLAGGLAGAAGAGQALWMATGESPLRRAARRVYLLPLLLPPYLTALAWMVLSGREGAAAWVLARLGFGAPSPFGLAGAVLVLGLTGAPAAAWLCTRALQDLEGEPVEAALLAGGPSRAWRRVVLPALAGPALAGAGIAFAFALAEYGVPSLLQWTVASQEVYAEFSRSGDPAAAAGFALPALLPALVAALAVAASGRVPAGRRAGGGASFGPAALAVPAEVRAWGWAGMAAGAAVLVLPPLVLAVQAVGGAGALEEVGAARGVLLRSLLQCGASGLMAAAAAALLAPPLFRGGGRWVAALCLAPLAVPGPLFGLGLQALVSRPGLSWVGDGSLLLVVGHGARFLPVALLALLDGMQRQDPALGEAAAVAGVGPMGRWWRVTLPLLGPSLATGAGLVAALSLGEIGAALLLTPPGGQTVALRLYNLLHYGADARVAALALAAVLSAAVVGGAAWALSRRRDR